MMACRMFVLDQLSTLITNFKSDKCDLKKKQPKLRILGRGDQNQTKLRRELCLQVRLFLKTQFKKYIFEIKNSEDTNLLQISSSFE